MKMKILKQRNTEIYILHIHKRTMNKARDKG